MGVMMLAASQGTTLTLITQGEDEAAAANALESLVKARFGEPE
jgi:phosphocarrier protein